MPVLLRGLLELGKGSSRRIGPVGKLECMYVCKNILKAKGHEQRLYVNGWYLATIQ